MAEVGESCPHTAHHTRSQPSHPGHEGEGGYRPVVVFLGDLLLAASQSVTAAAERGRDVGDGGVQLQPEKTIWQ